jgi:hypothetical protein
MMSDTFKEKEKGKARRAYRQQAQQGWRRMTPLERSLRFAEKNKRQPRQRVKHASDLAFCGCTMCTMGLHTGYGDVVVRRARSRARNEWRMALHNVADPELLILPNHRTPVGYTD